MNHTVTKFGQIPRDTVIIPQTPYPTGTTQPTINQPPIEVILPAPEFPYIIPTVIGGQTTTTTGTNPTSGTVTTTSGTVIGTVPTSAQCSCTIGTAYLDAHGDCKCASGAVEPLKVIDIDKTTGKQVIYYMMPTSTNTQPLQTTGGNDFLDTVKNNPLLFGAGALILILLLTRK